MNVAAKRRVMLGVARMGLHNRRATCTFQAVRPQTLGLIGLGAIGGSVAQNDLLAAACKDDRVLADHVPAAHDGETDVALAPQRFGHAVERSHFIECLATRLRDRLSQRERGAGGGIFFQAVVRLDDLDVELTR